MRKVEDGKRKEKKEKIISVLVATNVVASRPTDWNAACSCQLNKNNVERVFLRHPFCLNINFNRMVCQALLKAGKQMLGIKFNLRLCIHPVYSVVECAKRMKDLQIV